MKSYESRYLLFLLALSPAFENSAVSIQAQRLREKEELDLDDKSKLLAKVLELLKLTHLVFKKHRELS